MGPAVRIRTILFLFTPESEEIFWDWMMDNTMRKDQEPLCRITVMYPNTGPGATMMMHWSYHINKRPGPVMVNFEDKTLIWEILEDAHQISKDL